MQLISRDLPPRDQIALITLVTSALFSADSRKDGGGAAGTCVSFGSALGETGMPSSSVGEMFEPP